MADDRDIIGVHLAEDDEVEKARRWWKKYGVGIAAGVVIGMAGVVGIQGWQKYVDYRGKTASAIYQNMRDAVREGSGDAMGLGATLLKDHADTPYADGAALMLARMEFEAGNTDAALAQLDWVLQNSAEPSFRHAAVLRMARMALDRGEHDKAQALLTNEVGGMFQGMFDELRGDVLVDRGDSTAARGAYDAALSTLAKQSGGRLLEINHDRITR